MIVANFTQDTIEWQHIGVVGEIKAGEIKEYDDNRGRHILNKYGLRGLLQLQYGDSTEEIIEEKKEIAQRIWRAFWLKQVSYHNQNNEALKNAGGAYIAPTDELAEHAKVLGVDIIGPWSAARAEKDKEVETLRKETAELKAMLNNLMVGKVTGEAVKAAENANEETRKRFKNMNKEQLKPFVDENAADILSWPMMIVLELKEKYIRFYGDDSWPLAQ